MPTYVNRSQRGRLRWAEPPPGSSVSEFDTTQDSLWSLAVSSDTAPSVQPSIRVRQRPTSVSRVHHRGARKGIGLVAELEARCQSLESESLVLQRELKRVQELERPGSRPAGIPVPSSAGAPLPQACAVCGERFAGSVSGKTARSKMLACKCQRELEATVAELQEELGVMAMKAQQERESQASQIAWLESALQAAEERAEADLVDEAAAEFERWIAGGQSHPVVESSGSQSQPASASASASGSKSATEVGRSQKQSNCPAQSSRGASNIPPAKKVSAGSSCGSAGPLPPPAFCGTDLHALGKDMGQHEFFGSSGGHGLGMRGNFDLPSALGIGGNMSRCATERIDPFSSAESGFGCMNMKFDSQLTPVTLPGFGSSSFSPVLGAALGHSFVRGLNELPTARMPFQRQVRPDAWHGMKLDSGQSVGSSGAGPAVLLPQESAQTHLEIGALAKPPKEVACDEVPLVPLVPPPSRPPGLPPEDGPVLPLLSHCSAPSTQSAGQLPAASTVAHLEMKLTEANLREAIDALGVASQPTSTRCPSVANFGEVAGCSDQPTPVCHTARTIIGENTAGVSSMPTARSVGEDIHAGSKVSFAGGVGLDEEVAMKLYHRFGLGSCMSFEKFVQLHETHLSCEKPLVRPATGGA